jgi:phenylacetate-CoA ligase
MIAPVTVTGDSSPFRYLHQDTHFYQRTLELLDRQALQELQNEKFCRLVRQIRDNEFFRAKLQAHGSQIATLADLSKIPVTTKAELVRSQAEFPPYGELLTYPVAQYPYFHTTGGTTGKPLVWLDTRED